MKTRTITAPSGSDSALKTALTTAIEPTGTLASILASALLLVEADAIGIVNVSLGKVSIHPAASLSALTTALATVGTVRTLTPTTPADRSTFWTANTGFTAAVAGHPGYITSADMPALMTSLSGADPAAPEDTTEVAAVSAAAAVDVTDGMLLKIYGVASAPKLTVAQVIAAAEDSAGEDIVLLVDQVNKVIKFAVGTTDISATGSPLAVFVGTASASAGAQFAE